MTSPAVQRFQKDHAALKHYMIGRGYSLSLKALGFAAQYHTGLRKDKETPELHHQVRIMFNIISLRDVQNEELCLALAAVHDTDEDYNVGHRALTQATSLEVADKASILNKNHYSSDILYFAACAADLDCSVVKGCDNMDNIQTMHGAFTPEKIVSYMTRTERDVLPMLKQASQYHPQQHFAYAGIRTNLKGKLELYRAMGRIGS